MHRERASDAENEYFTHPDFAENSSSMHEVLLFAKADLKPTKNSKKDSFLVISADKYTVLVLRNAVTEVLEIIKERFQKRCGQWHIAFVQQNK